MSKDELHSNEKPKEVHWRSRRLFIAILSIVLLFFFLIGLYDSPLSVFTRENEFRVEAEYLSGLLTSLSILFGIWAIMIDKKPENVVYKWFFEHVAGKGFFISFGLLVISIIFVSLTALNLFSPTISVIFCTLNFCYNALIISITVYLMKFFIKETGRESPFHKPNNETNLDKSQRKNAQ